MGDYTDACLEVYGTAGKEEAVATFLAGFDFHVGYVGDEYVPVTPDEVSDGEYVAEGVRPFDPEDLQPLIDLGLSFAVDQYGFPSLVFTPDLGMKTLDSETFYGELDALCNASSDGSVSAADVGAVTGKPWRDAIDALRGTPDAGE